MKMQHNDTLIAFRKAKSHIETIIKMIEEGKYCVAIMQQNLAVIGLLRSAHEKLMENHLHTCFLKGMKTGSAGKKQQMIEEIEKVMHLSK